MTGWVLLACAGVMLGVGVEGRGRRRLGASSLGGLLGVAWVPVGLLVATGSPPARG